MWSGSVPALLWWPWGTVSILNPTTGSDISTLIHLAYHELIFNYLWSLVKTLSIVVGNYSCQILTAESGGALQ